MKVRDKSNQKRANWKKQKLCTKMTTLKKLLLILSKRSEKILRQWGGGWGRMLLFSRKEWNKRKEHKLKLV